MFKTLVSLLSGHSSYMERNTEMESCEKKMKICEVLNVAVSTLNFKSVTSVELQYILELAGPTGCLQMSCLIVCIVNLIFVYC